MQKSFRLLSRQLPKTVVRFQSASTASSAPAVQEIKKDKDLTNINVNVSIPELNPGGILNDFFDAESNFNVTSELRLRQRPGRSWTVDELRLKSNTDLHKLWYVLLKEKNMLLTMEHAYKIRQKSFPNPERLDRVHESMENLEAVVHERNDAFLKLETGDGADPPVRTVTSFAGFTYKKQAEEHLLPFEVTGEKEYEVPYLDESAYVTQKLWAEKQHLKKMHDADTQRHRERWSDRDASRFLRGSRKHLNCVEHLPK